MKTRVVISIGIGIPILGIILGLYLFSVDSTSYDVQIHGMKKDYTIGDHYSFYYTVSGYGNTCGLWHVSYPDKKGVIQNEGAVVDCTKPVNKILNYDSRKDYRQFTSFFPQDWGVYNVTVSIENAQPVSYEFNVRPPDVSPIEILAFYGLKEQYHVGDKLEFSIDYNGFWIWDEHESIVIRKIMDLDGTPRELVIGEVYQFMGKIPIDETLQMKIRTIHVGDDQSENFILEEEGVYEVFSALSTTPEKRFVVKGT